MFQMPTETFQKPEIQSGFSFENSFGDFFKNFDKKIDTSFSTVDSDPQADTNGVANSWQENFESYKENIPEAPSNLPKSELKPAPKSTFTLAKPSELKAQVPRSTRPFSFTKEKTQKSPPKLLNLKRPLKPKDENEDGLKRVIPEPTTPGISRSKQLDTKNNFCLDKAKKLDLEIKRFPQTPGQTIKATLRGSEKKSAGLSLEKPGVFQASRTPGPVRKDLKNPQKELEEKMTDIKRFEEEKRHLDELKRTIEALEEAGGVPCPKQGYECLLEIKESFLQIQLMLLKTRAEQVSILNQFLTVSTPDLDAKLAKLSIS